MKAALYLRLSREDQEKEGDSQSIQNQRCYLEDFISKKGWGEGIIYCDDGYSGTNFQRPAFQKMIADIKDGLIDTVVTKDMSRLGRDYIETGYYMERFFPLHQVRFIAVNDGIDTGEQSRGEMDEMTPFRAVINDMYARDISKKVRSALDTKRIHGAFIGSVAPFGYEKSAYNKNQLIPCKKTAPIVREIFQKYMELGSLSGVARILNAQKIPTPAQYHDPDGCKTQGIWRAETVKRILSNPSYAGNICQNRTRKINYKLNKRIALPENQWVIVQDTHEGIISLKQFEQAAEILKQKHRKIRITPPLPPWKKLLICKDCGFPMVRSSQNNNRFYWVCSGWKKKNGCNSSHCISEKTLEKALKQYYSQEFQQALGNEFYDHSLFWNTLMAYIQIGNKHAVSIHPKFKQPL